VKIVNMVRTVQEMESFVLESLRGTDYACSRLERLAGGVANFTYRGHLAAPPEQGEKTIIIKHSEDYIPFAPDFKLDSIRSVNNPFSSAGMYSVC
jgi:hypothetical protein